MAKQNKEPELNEEELASLLSFSYKPIPDVPFFTDEEAGRVLELHKKIWHEGLSEEEKDEMSRLDSGKQYTKEQFVEFQLAFFEEARQRDAQRKPARSIHTKHHDSLSSELQMVEDLTLIGKKCLREMKIPYEEVSCFLLDPESEVPLSAKKKDGTILPLPYDEYIYKGDREEEAQYEMEALWGESDLNEVKEKLPKYSAKKLVPRKKR